MYDSSVSSLLTLAGEAGKQPRPFGEVILEQIKSLKSELNKKHFSSVGITEETKSVSLGALNNFVVQTRDRVYSYFQGYSMIREKFQEDKEWIEANREFDVVKWTERMEQWKKMMRREE